jgi:hypothetical protein
MKAYGSDCSREMKWMNCIRKSKVTAHLSRCRRVDKKRARRWEVDNAF